MDWSKVVWLLECAPLFLVKGWYAGITLENCNHSMTVGIVSALIYVLTSELIKHRFSFQILKILFFKSITVVGIPLISITVT